MSFQSIRKMLITPEQNAGLINELTGIFITELEIDIKRRMDYMKQSYAYLKRLEQEVYTKHDIVYTNEYVNSTKKYKQHNNLLNFCDIYMTVDYSIYIELLVLDDYCQRTEDALYNIHYNIIKIKEKWGITLQQLPY